MEKVYLKASCEDNQDFYHIAMSEQFNIHSYPRTGMLQVTDTGFTYKGKPKFVQGVLDALENTVVGVPSISNLKSSRASNKVFVTKEEMVFWP